MDGFALSNGESRYSFDPATSAAVQNAGTMGFAEATVATGTLARAAFYSVSKIGTG